MDVWALTYVAHQNQSIKYEGNKEKELGSEAGRQLTKVLAQQGPEANNCCTFSFFGLEWLFESGDVTESAEK